MNMNMNIKMDRNLNVYTQKIESFLKEILTGDILLYSVEESGIPRYPKIAVTLDKKSGISIGECMDIHNLIIQKFNDEDLLNYFTLEVTSCGLTRILKHPWEIEKNISKYAKFVFRREIEGKITMEGYIEGREGNIVYIKDKSGIIYSVNYDEIKKIQLSIEEGLKK